MIFLTLCFQLFVISECVNISVIEDLYNVIKSQSEYENLTVFELKTSTDFNDENPLPSSMFPTLFETRKYNFIHDVIEEIAYEVNTTSSALLENDEFLIPLHLKFTEKDCELGPSHGQCSDDQYRSLDGSCNNMVFPTWGMSGQVLRRYLSPGYHDGVEMQISLDITGEPLPSAREISKLLHRQSDVMDMNIVLSAMVMQWGQFLEHDILSVPAYRDKHGQALDCCGRDKNDHECFSINVPQNDPFFNTRCIPMVRSAPGVGPMCYTTKREQLNLATAFIDGSHIYGTNTETLRQIVDANTGKLKVNGNNMIPAADPVIENCILEKSFDYCPKLGDDRINLSPALTSMYTLFVREHNRLVDKLQCRNPHWLPEFVFQEARKIIVALIQQITYTEYLPVILGKEGMWKYGLTINIDGYDYSAYNPNVNAGIANSFASAAIKFIHTQMPDMLGFYDNQTQYVDLEKTFHRPWYAQQDGGRGMEEIMKWLVNDAQPETNRFYVRALTDSYLEFNGSSLDLAAIDIQRGRDHGLPAYNSWRRFCSLPIADKFENLLDHEPEMIQKLKEIYKSPMDIDLLTGALTERKRMGTEIGPTFSCIVGLQFSELKKGDRFWFENPDPRTGFTIKQLSAIRRMSLAKIMCNNLDIERIQQRVMFLPSEEFHPRAECSEIPDLDFSAWQDDPSVTANC
ncbi:peroxidasin-like [Saccostrea echinata]|uniref:peroxidasin-like n=1 Tax=Saccostrea echinata TaxID=191078 RepID=UPI002A82F245|nr:peroxidasin-like [Saccostrea echinata]